MKLPDLKEKFSKKYMIRMVAGALVVVMIGGGVGAYQVYGEKTTGQTTTSSQKDTKKDETETKLEKQISDMTAPQEMEVGKDETVYMIADAAGTVQEQIVSEWLKNANNEKTLADATDLTDIENVKGDEEYTAGEGDAITWQADGNDIYYQGKTTKTAPITEKITYYLDGEEKTPEEIAGATGKVTIRFDYTNNEKVTKKVNGKDTEINVPFAVISGLILNDDCTNIEVKNGKLVSDGKNNIVVGYALPGLKESLDVDEKDFNTDLEIPEYVEITTDATDFKLDMTMTVAMSNPLSMSMDDLDLTDLDDTVDQLSNAGGELKDGSATLASGADSLETGAGSLATGADTLETGASTLASAIGTYTKGVSSAKTGADSAASGALKLNTYVHSLTDGYVNLLDSTSSGAATYGKKASDLYASQADATAALSGAITAYVGAQEYYTGYGSALETIEQTTQAVIANAAAGIQAANTAGDPTLNAVVAGLNGIAASDYVTLDTNTGAYTVDKDGYTAAMATAASYISQAAAGVETTAKGAIDGGVNAEVAASAAYASAQRPAEAEAYITAGEDALKSAGQLEAAAATLTSSAASFGDTYAQFAASTAAKDSAYLNLVGNDETVGVATKVCTYFGNAGASEALDTVHQSLVDSGISKKAMKQIADGADDLSTGLSTLKAGLKLIEKNNEALNSGADQVSSGASQLSSGADQLSSGATQLSNGADQLAAGVVQFNEEGINKLVDAYNGDAKTLVARIQAVIEAGEDYQTYTKLPEGVNGSVKFIWRTDAVKADADAKDND